MSNRNKKEIQKFFDAAECYSNSYLNSIKGKLNLTDVVQAAKVNVIEDILFIRTLQY